jgi:hypothetical protein
MFGPGIYFANASCKSTAYSDKYMLLCEVDLGNTLVMYNSNNSLIVSKPYDSVTAYGKPVSVVSNEPPKLIKVTSQNK